MMNNDNNEGLTLVEHLSELRKRVLFSFISFIIASLIGYNFSERIAKDIIGRAPDMDFIYISPSELMLSYIRIALFIGIILASPIIITQIWLFISPGLSRKERRYVRVSILLGGGFFIVGALFSYEIVLPFIFKFFAGFQTEDIKATISFANYLNFIIRIVLAFGLVFELPIIMYLLSKFSLVSPEFFIRNRKYMVLVIFIVAAILTPPDVISQSMLAIPMVILYQIGIFLARIGYNKD